MKELVRRICSLGPVVGSIVVAMRPTDVSSSAAHEEEEEGARGCESWQGWQAPVDE